MASARLRLARALASLRAAIGPPLPAEFDVVGELESGAPLPEVGRLREEMLANYPSLAQSRAEVRRAEARLETERALRAPQPSVRAGIERQPDQNRFVVGIGLPIPLWDQRQGPIGEAVAALQDASASADRRQLELVAALEDAYERYAVATQQVAAYESGLLRQAEAALRAAEAAYRFGERGFIEVLDAQRVLRTVRTDFLAARFDRQAALIDLEQLRATGAREQTQ
jgi:cobalt-zinc-cadmium efflux system outer membrane protein